MIFLADAKIAKKLTNACSVFVVFACLLGSPHVWGSGETFTSKDLSQIKNRLKGCVKKDPVFSSKIDYLISKVKPNGAEPPCVTEQSGVLSTDQFHLYTGVIKNLDEYAGTQTLEIHQPETTSAKIVLPYTTDGQKKAGFGQNKNGEEDLAKNFHDALMDEDRKLCMRNYVYYTQRFNFAEGASFDTKWVDGMNDKKIQVEGNLLLEKDPYKVVENYDRTANNFFQAYGWDPKRQGFTGALMLGNDETHRLGAIANAEVQRIKSDYPKKEQRLNLDQVYDRLVPYLQNAGFQAANSYTVTAKKNLTSDASLYEKSRTSQGGELQAASRQREGQFRRQADFENQSLQLAISNADREQNDISFLLHSSEFNSISQTQFAQLTKDQIKAKLKKSLLEKVEATTNYAKDFIQNAQANSNMWGKRDADDYAELEKSLLYSSPLAIQKVASEHPDWLAALCLPLSKVQDLGKSTLPSWVDFGGGLFGVAKGIPGILASATFGYYASSVYHGEKQRGIAAIQSHAGVNGIDPRAIKAEDVNQGNHDEATLAKAYQSEDDAVLKDVAKSVFSGALGAAVPGAGKYIYSEIEAVALKKIAISALKEGGEPITETATKELMDLGAIAKKKLGRTPTSKELIAIRDDLTAMKNEAPKIDAPVKASKVQAERIYEAQYVTPERARQARNYFGDLLGSQKEAFDNVFLKTCEENGWPVDLQQKSAARDHFLNLLYNVHDLSDVGTQEKIYQLIESKKVIANALSAENPKEIDQMVDRLAKEHVLGKNGGSHSGQSFESKQPYYQKDLTADKNYFSGASPSSGSGVNGVQEVVRTKRFTKEFVKAPNYISNKAQKWIDQVEEKGLREVRKSSGLHDEPLTGDRAGQRSIRLNDGYRLIYREVEDGKIEVLEVNKEPYRH